MFNLISTVSNKQDLSSPEGFNKLNQPRGQASAFSKLLSEQVFCRFTGEKESQMQIISYMAGSREKPSKCITVVLCMKKNMSSGISAEHSCEFTAREDSASQRPV